MILIVEVKQSDFAKGWGEYLAELVAAQRLNMSEKQTIYGIVTNAELWQFGKLEDEIFTKNKTRVKIEDLDEVFGTNHAIMELTTKEN